MGVLREMRRAVADALADLPNIMQSSPYLLGNPTLPAVMIVPSPIEYDQAFQRGSDDYLLTVQVVVADSIDAEAQDLLDTYIEPTGAASLKAKLEEDDTLGGRVSSLRVERCEGYRFIVRQDGTPMLGAEWTVRVNAPGN